MSDTPAPEPRKFKLRRIKPSTEIIQKNLEPLKENIKKKRRAQQAYYENHNDSGVSPLVRDFKKRPVHQRLGRKLPYILGTNTSAILPKMRLRPAGQQLYRKTRIFTAQQRLNRIRARNQEAHNMNMNTPKRIRLRRTLPQHMNGVGNLMVQVKNNAAFPNTQFSNSFRRFKQILNMQLQQEIRKIQDEYQGSQTIGSVHISPAATTKLLNKRFTELS